MLLRAVTFSSVFNGEEGFDTRFKFSTSGLFGTGTYFAVNASYSASPRYSHTVGPGMYTFILAKALTGNAFQMKAYGSHKQFPNKPPRTPFSEEPNPAHYNVVGAGAARPRGPASGGVDGMEPEPEPEGIGVEAARHDSIAGTGGSEVFIVHGNFRAYPSYCVTFSAWATAVAPSYPDRIRRQPVFSRIMYRYE